MTMFFFYSFLTILGLIIGSFLGMLTYRLPRGLSISGRSVCPKCKNKIPWYRNIPIVSFLFLRGKCGTCGREIHWRYPAIEFATAASFLATGYLWLHLKGGNLILQTQEVLGIFALPFLLLLVTCYLALIIIDLEFQILPDQILLFLGAFVIFVLFLLPSPAIFEHLLWGFVSFIFFLAIYLVTRGRGMGFGDVKMSFVLGALLSFPGIIVWLFLSFLTGAIVGIILMLAGRARMGSHIPFGPYLLVSSWVALFWGGMLFEWYMKFL